MIAEENVGGGSPRVKNGKRKVRKLQRLVMGERNVGAVPRMSNGTCRTRPNNRLGAFMTNLRLCLPRIRPFDWLTKKPSDDS